MRSTKPISVIIACPHCGTRYQVPPETLGDAGRKVACAHCGQSWMADPGAAVPPPQDDRLFSEADEAALDQGFTDEAARSTLPAGLRQLIPDGEQPPPEVVRSIAEIKAALESKSGKTLSTVAPDDKRAAIAHRKAQGRLEKRQRAFARALPSARLTRVLRGVGVGLLLGVVSGAVLFRTEIVRMLPDLAGLYEAVGLKVNVVGLEFSDVTTLLSRRGDGDVMTVNATIYGVEPRRLLVPPVLVTLLGADDAPVYAWSVAPKVHDLEPGEVIGFSAELPSPPAAAQQVRLSFADSARPLAPPVSTDPQPVPVASADTTTAEPEESAH